VADKPLLPDPMEALSLPFNPDLVMWRVGATTGDKDKGMALAYVDARVIVDRLDDVLGAGNWQNRYINAGNNKTCCEIGIRMKDGEWVWKSDGAGDTGMEADKGAFTDAFKRAAVRWGIARYLYSLGATWVRLQKRGNSHIIDPSEMGRLKDLVRFGYTGEIAKGSDEALNWATEMLERLSECSDLDDVNNLAADNQTEFGMWFKKEPNIANDVKHEIDKRRKELK
jgi:hypothetical protein